MPTSLPESKPSLKTRFLSWLRRPDSTLVRELTQEVDRFNSSDPLISFFGQGLEQALSVGVLQIFTRRVERFRQVWAIPENDRRNDLMLLPHDGVWSAALAWRGPQRLSSLPFAESTRAWIASARLEQALALIDRAQDEVVGFALFGLPRGRSADARALQSLGDAVGARLRALERVRLGQLRSVQGRSVWLKECPHCQRCFDTTVFVCPDDDSDLEATQQVDRLVADRYLIEKRLGLGATSAVYLARDEKTKTLVALKLVARADDSSAGRFANEERAGRRLNHPAIAQVLDSGDLGPHRAFLVIELVPGKTLRALLKRHKALDPARVARLFDQVLAGVHFAHENGVIHRDLKPENLMVAEIDGHEQVKVLDFGLAKVNTGDSGSHPAMTRDGMVLGTLSYMSPEQLAGQKVDARCDMFTLGVMIHEALTGALPFGGESLPHLLRAVAFQPYALATFGSEQELVGAILGRAVAKSPADRYPDLAAFRAELIPALKVCPPFSGSRAEARV